MDGLSDAFAPRPAPMETVGLSMPAGAPLAVAYASPCLQRSLAAPISCQGIGLHGGRPARLTLCPAEPDHGIVFVRMDLGGATIPARHDRVVDTRLCTVLGHSPARVGTVEHLLAALAGAGVDNARIEIDGPEVPILDGSAEPFLFLIDCAGIAMQSAPRRVLSVRRPVRVAQNSAWAELLPNPEPGFRLECAIDFAAAAIGRQSLSLVMSEAVFRTELASARTFTVASEVAQLQEAGLALGGSLDNAVVVRGASVLNPGGLRMNREFVRHKMLDAVGDLALAGAPLHGIFRASRGGHAINNALLHELFADRANWRLTAPSPGRPLRAAA